jgi:hypothetical protein
MKIKVALPVFLLLAFFLQAATAADSSQTLRSAARQRGVSYLKYVEKTLKVLDTSPRPRALTAIDSAQVYGRAVYPEIQSWQNREELQSRFGQLRDKRWLNDPARRDFLRRSTWLFPDDGCYARAALAVANLLDWNTPAPNKIFAFGDLTARTPNTPYGEVTWWYHVAPVVSVDGVKYVLDPSIDPSRPLTVDEWLVRMSPYPKQLHVAICASGTYGPDNDCADASRQSEGLALSDQGYFLDQEWSRLRELVAETPKLN